MTLAARRNDLAATSRRNAEVLVAMGMSGRLTRRWSEANETYLAGNQRASDIAGGLGAVAKVLRMMLQSAVLAVGAYLVIHQEATAGIIIAGSILSARALAPVDLAIAHWKGFVAARQSWHRLAKLLQQIPAANEQTLLQAPSKRLSVEAVSIVPPGDQRVIVQDVNFAAEAGTGIGVIGPSGSGKSSLVRALVGVWMPARGKVRLDGAALDQWSSDVLGRHIGYLPQDVELFAGTVAQNICRFDPEAKSEAIIAAAKEAGVHEMIIKMREGYDTQIGEQGTALSAGQAQRVALARALYGNPFLIVLDEPNSNLDSEGDEALTPCGARRARARRHRGRGGAPADRHRGGRPVAGVEGRPHAGVRAEGNRARPGAAARSAPDADQDRVRSGSCEKIMTAELKGAHRSIRGHLIFGLTLILVLAVGFGGWASTAQISGALIAPGSVVVDSNVKKVQHPTGGVVGEVRVRDGDIVKAGDIVVRLDETVVKASLAIVVKTLNGLWARAARLEAEQRGLDQIKFPPMLTDRADDPDVRDILASETKLFEVRVFGRAGQKSQLRERVLQLNEEISGLTAQEQAKEKEVALVEKELIGVRQLYEQRLIQLSRLTVLERDLARLSGERAQYIASRAQAKGKITETELQIIQVDKDVVSEVSKDLRETNDKIGEFVERKVTAEDQLRRIDIRAPQDGVVLQSTVHTVGGVITAGDAIMMVVPRADDLSVEAKVNPQDIDKLQIGQKTLLRLSAFNQRTTPELNGVVTRVSADVTTDQRTGQSYYTIRVSLPPAEVARLGDNVKIIPGMPVEAFVQTGDRTMFSYLMKPFSDQLMRSFRER